MRRIGAALMGVVLTTAACGGDDDSSGNGDEPGVESDAETGDDNDNGDDNGDDDNDNGDDIETGQSPDFDPATLPDDFPDELVPPDWDTGQYTAVTGVRTATFESSATFEDVIAYYDGVHGESFVVGDPGEELAQWLQNPPWVVSVFNDDPLLIGISELPDQ